MFILLLLFFVVYPLTTAGQDPLRQIFNEHPDKFSKVLSHPERYKVQIIYTQIDRDALNRPIFTDHSFHLDKNKYFYPASTVKLPIAVMAMDKVRKLNISGFELQSTMLTDSAYEGQTQVMSDSTSVNGLPSIAQYIKKILLLSDNDAFNRLYEFLGQSTIFDRLAQLGFAETRIIHRLSTFLPPELNRCTNPVRFYNGDNLVYEQPLVCNDSIIRPIRSVRLGKGYMNGDLLVSQPMDFTHKNAMPLADLHSMLRAIIFPGEAPAGNRFDLGEADYRFLYKFMSMYPGESGIPGYDNYDDGYCKFFIFGGEGQSRYPDLRIFNKVGEAYGFITETAFIVDFEKKVEFMLSATLYTNENEIFMDDAYEYDVTGFPFFRDLGQAVYEYEQHRTKTSIPDLSRFKINYK